jgi:two-component system, OmpR family, osmolarity sensor histidine kinase EnvZ
VAVPVDTQTWWLTFRSNRPSLLWGMLPVLLIAIAAALALVLGVRLITRPMSQLSQDLLARRYELRRIDEPPDVSIELRGVIRSFNSLVHAVELSAESRRNLLAGVSHDLRTPLARLRLRVEIECPEAVAQRLEIDFLAIGRIIDQFLAYAQGQSGVAIGRMRPIAGLIDEVVSRYQAEGADVSFIRAEAVHLNVPDLGVQRALINLVDNARSHGRGAVEIELWAEHDEVLVIVYDHGRGIAEHEFEKSFQPFVRLGSSTDREGHCGLGLAIVAQVAEQLGGRPVCKAFDGQRSGVGFGLPA